MYHSAQFPFLLLFLNSCVMISLFTKVGQLPGGSCANEPLSPSPGLRCVTRNQAKAPRTAKGELGFVTPLLSQSQEISSVPDTFRGGFWRNMEAG